MAVESSPITTSADTTLVSESMDFADIASKAFREVQVINVQLAEQVCFSGAYMRFSLN